MNDFLEKAKQILGEDRVNQLQDEGYVIAQIKNRRKELGISQSKLALKIGLPKSTIGRIEAGLNSPSVDTLSKIAQGLEMSIVINNKTPSQVQNYKIQSYNSKQYNLGLLESVSTENKILSVQVSKDTKIALTQEKLYTKNGFYSLGVPIEQYPVTEETLVGVGS